MKRRGVLAYATSMSNSELLSATNSQRGQNGSGTLTINQQLTSAAQAKANDMIARNYWSHNTPDGQEPWVFMNNAGYAYQKAGENLAYGFTTSDDTVTGWMNSPSHRSNLLDGEFSEVGFGFANGSNFNNGGPETVVVAMYGKPQVLAASQSTNPAPPEQPAVAPQAHQAAALSPAAVPVSQSPASSTLPAETPTSRVDKPKIVAITTDTPIFKEPPSQQISRIQTLTGGKAPWALFAVGLMSGAAAMTLLVKHAAGLRHLLRDSERFVLHHPLFDLFLVSVLAFGSLLSQTSGVIR